MPKKGKGTRPFKTDYGTTCGHCETPRGSLKSATQYLLKTGKRHCVIETPYGTIDVWYNGWWGVVTQVRKKNNVVPLKKVA